MFSYFANPKRFDSFARIAAPICGVLALLSLLTGVVWGLWFSPEDFRQGHSVRIMYVHVPAAWCAMLAYGVVATLSLISYVWRHVLADHIARGAAFCGCVFTALALVTGSIWGATAWGTWWEWDGRMTSMLILFFIYLGYLAVWSAIDDQKRAARIAQIIALVGIFNVVIVKISSNWRGHHQDASFSEPGAPGMAPELWLPLAFMMLAYTLILAWAVMRLGQANIRKARQLRETRQSTGATVTIKDAS